MIQGGKPSFKGAVGGGGGRQRFGKILRKCANISLKKIRNAFNSFMFPLFMNCHGLAKVNDKQGHRTEEGEIPYSRRHWESDFSVLSFQCQHQTSEAGFSLGLTLLS